MLPIASMATLPWLQADLLCSHTDPLFVMGLGLSFQDSVYQVVKLSV